MLVRDFLIEALQQRAYARKAWIYGTFGTLVDKPEGETIPYLPYHTDTEVFFYPPGIRGGRVILEDAVAGQPVCRWNDRIDLKVGDIPNLKAPVNTPVGNLLFNWMVLVESFGSKYPFVTGPVNMRDIERQIVDRLVDDVPIEQRNTTDLYCDEYLTFIDRGMNLPNFNQLAVPSASPKNLTGDPGMEALRTELLKKYGDDLDNPVTVARIYEELVKLDKEYVSDYGRGFFIEDKQFTNIRLKVHGMMGLLAGFSETEKPVLVVKSLVEGWDYDNLAAYVNSARDGSFSRGWETMYGGVEAKRNIRATQNSQIVAGDCGTNITKDVIVDRFNKNEQLNLYHMVDNKPVRITKDNVDSLVGTVIHRRTPQGCREKDNDYCSICIGSALSENPESLGARGGEMGNIFLSTFMKKMHVSTLSLSRFNIKNSLS